MLLYIIIKVTGLNTSFYIGFVFIFSKTYTDYHWVLSYVQEFYIDRNILGLIFTRTDFEKALIRVLKIVIPQIEYELYL